jgi:hypothetical protein
VRGAGRAHDRAARVARGHDVEREIHQATVATLVACLEVEHRLALQDAAQHR